MFNTQYCLKYCICCWTHLLADTDTADADDCYTDNQGCSSNNHHDNQHCKNNIYLSHYDW